MEQQKSVASIEKQINEITSKLESRARNLTKFQVEIYSLLNRTENGRIFDKIKELSSFEPNARKCAIELASFLYEMKKDVFEDTKTIIPKDLIAEFDEQVLLACENAAALFSGAYLLCLKKLELDLLRSRDAHSVN